MFARHEAITDLVHIFNSLVNTCGNILIPGVNDSVRELTDEEAATYEPIQFDVVSITVCCLKVYVFGFYFVLTI
jgi:hypothetical protein